MQIKVSTRHTELRQNDKDLIVEKIERLGGKFLEMDRADVHLFEERNPRIRDKDVCEITLEGHGHHIRCKSNGPDHLTAVDRAIEKLENKLHKLKTKLSTHRTHRDVTRSKQWSTAETASPPTITGDELSAEATALVDSYRIVKTKTVERRTLTALDAAMRMDLLEHPFYFFTNVDTGRSAVIYRRDDGDVGLIDEVD